MRICTVYSTVVRPDNTGIYFDPALKSLGHQVVHFEPYDERRTFKGWDGLPKADLYLRVDDDHDYYGPTVGFGGKTAYVAIDTHLDPGARAVRAKGFDRVFVAQRNGVGVMATMGVEAKWLPLAYDPEKWKPAPPKTPKVFDWVFVGNPNPTREGVCAEIQKHFPNGFTTKVYGVGQLNLYHHAKIILDIPILDDVNMRFFEAAGAGGLLVTRSQGNGEDDHLPGLVRYSDMASLIEIIGKWTKDDAGRTELARKQQAHAQQFHTYKARCKALLEGI